MTERTLSAVFYEGNITEQTPEIIYYNGDYSECDKPEVVYLEGEPYIVDGLEWVREEEYYAQKEEPVAETDAAECDKSFVSSKENIITPEEFEAYDYYVMEQEWIYETEDNEKNGDSFWYFCRFVEVDSTPDYFYEEDEPDYDPDNVSDITRIRQIIDKCKNYTEVNKYCYIDWDNYYNIEVKFYEDWKKYDPYSFDILNSDKDIEGEVKERIAEYIKRIDNTFPDLLYLCRAAIVFKPLNSSLEANNVITEPEIEEPVIAEPVIEEPVIEETEEEYIEEDFIDEEDEDFIEEEYIDEDDEDGFEWSIEDIEQPTEIITEAVLPEAAEPTIEEPAAPEAEEQPEPINIMPEPENNNKNEITLSSDINTTEITTNSTKTDELHSLPGLYNPETETTAIANFEKLLIAEPDIKSFINEYEAALNYVQGLLSTIANTKRFKKVKFAKGAIYKTVEEYIKYINSCLWDEAITVIENAKLYIDNDAKSIEESKDIIAEIINTKNIMATIEMYTKTAEKVYSYCESQTSYLTVAPVKPKRLYSFNK